MFKIRRVSNDTCEDYMSPQSLQLFPDSMEGVIHTPQPQLSEWLT